MRNHHVSGLILLARPAAVLGTERAAAAQSLRPNILFIFDTSGSMGQSASGSNVGDDTNICPSGTGSKLHGLKSALRAALAQVGADEANFGLMSFPQVVGSNPNTARWCGTSSWGHYNPTAGVSNVTIPNRTTSGNHSATSYPSGCLMSLNTTQSSYDALFDTGLSQVLRVGVTTAALGATPTPVNLDPADGNIPESFRWIDNVERPATSAAVTAPELHASGSTPIGRSLMYGRLYYDNEVKPVDPRGSCRQNIIILVTDGGETCDEVTAPDTNFSLTSCAGGVAYNPFHPVAQACQLFRQSNIKTFVVTDSGVSSSELTANNRVMAAGGTTAAITASLADPNAAKAAIVGIIARAVPPAEVCDGKDDDCNGQIDDGPLPGVGSECGIQGQGCSKGVTVCLNGQIVCSTMSSPQPEVCNGLDDDCNGVIDDGVFPGVGDSCVCDGLDPSQVNVGLCRAGRLACKGAQGLKCEGCVLPTPEICDGKDNDCDGNADQTAMCPNGFGCRDGSCNLQCRGGEFPCPPGYDCVDTYCVPNRCNDVTCGAGQRCDLDTGSCVDLCYKVTCLSEQTCAGGKCLDCSNSDLLACPKGQLCVGRQCITDTCAGVSCASAEYCSNGACVPLGCGQCGADEKCIAGTCKPFHCADASCGAGTYCDYATGSCLPDLCATKSCPDCAPATGECMAHPCATVQCPSCYACGLPPDGTPFCQQQSTCATGTVALQTAGAGGGCHCGGEAGRPAPDSLLWVAGGVLLLVLTRRPRGPKGLGLSDHARGTFGAR